MEPITSLGLEPDEGEATAGGQAAPAAAVERRALK